MAKINDGIFLLSQGDEFNGKPVYRVMSLKETEQYMKNANADIQALDTIKNYKIKGYKFGYYSSFCLELEDLVITLRDGELSDIVFSISKDNNIKTIDESHELFIFHNNRDRFTFMSEIHPDYEEKMKLKEITFSKKIAFNKCKEGEFYFDKELNVYLFLGKLYCPDVQVNWGGLRNLSFKHKKAKDEDGEMQITDDYNIKLSYVAVRLGRFDRKDVSNNEKITESTIKFYNEWIDKIKEADYIENHRKVVGSDHYKSIKDIEITSQYKLEDCFTVNEARLAISKIKSENSIYDTIKKVEVHTTALFSEKINVDEDNLKKINIDLLAYVKSVAQFEINTSFICLPYCDANLREEYAKIKSPDNRYGRYYASFITTNYYNDDLKNIMSLCLNCEERNKESIATLTKEIENMKEKIKKSYDSDRAFEDIIRNGMYYR